MATMLILLDSLLTSLTMCSSSDLLTSHLSNVTFNLVQQRLPEPNLPPSKAFEALTKRRCIQTLAKWSQVSEFSVTITDQLSSTVRWDNWSEVVLPPGKVTTKCDLQRLVDCIYTRAVYHPGSVRLPFMCSSLNLSVRFT